jgi:glutamine amidotransferase
MNTVVTVVDFGTGNMLSVCRALRRCAADVTVTDEETAIDKAERLVLPGVGAFGDAMAGLNARGLAPAVRRYVESGRPFLGICVGMQMMFEGSEEFGWHEGLGLVAGKVRAIPPDGEDGRTHKIPHIGWTSLRVVNGGGDNAWRGNVLDGIGPKDSVYFVHSFTGWPDEEADRLADADYNGQRIAAAVRRGNAYGCQFHPEKSGRVGLRILENFLGLSA